MERDVLLAMLRARDELIVDLKKALLDRDKYVGELETRLTMALANKDAEASPGPPQGDAPNETEMARKAGSIFELLDLNRCSGLHSDGWLSLDAKLTLKAPQPGRDLSLSFYLPEGTGEGEKNLSVKTDFDATKNARIGRGKPAQLTFKVPPDFQGAPAIFVQTNVAEEKSVMELRELGVLVAQIQII